MRRRSASAAATIRQGPNEFGPWQHTCATTEHLSPALMHD